MTGTLPPPPKRTIPVSRPGLGGLLADGTELVGDMPLAADRFQSLFRAVVSIGSHLDLEDVLERVVETAAELTDARYAALGVLEPDGGGELSQLITTGLDAHTVAAVGRLPAGRGVLGVLRREVQPLRVVDVNKHPAAVGFPPGHPVMHSFLGVPVSVLGSAFGTLYLADKRDDDEFTLADEQLVLTLASAAGLAVQNARLYEQAQQRQQWLEAISSLTTRLLAGEPPETVLPETVGHARQLGRADLAILALNQPDGTLIVAAADGHDAGVLLGRHIPYASMTAQVARDGTPVAVLDAPHDARVWPGLLADVPVGPALYVPLGTADGSVGALVVTRRPGQPRFADDALRVVETFGAQAAIAMRLGAAAADREQVAVLGDRDRIARDLHDLVIQRVFGIGLSLEGTARSLVGEPASRVRTAIDDLDGIIREIRTTVFELQSPTPMFGGGIRAAVIESATAASDGFGFQPSVSFQGPVDSAVPAPVADQLVAVLRESLSNAARHAHATAVAIAVVAAERMLTLTVIDDGDGIPPDGRRSGLRNMASRATDLGGTFDVGPGPAGGTTIRWSVPLEV